MDPSQNHRSQSPPPSELLPYCNLQDTMSMCLHLQNGIKKVSRFLSFQTKQRTFSARTCLTVYCPLPNATAEDLC